MCFLFPLVYFITVTGFFVILFKKSFAKCLPLSFMISAFTLFISQFLFKTFLVGVIINLMVSLLFFFFLYKIIRKREIKEFKTLFFSKGFYLFLILYIGVFLFDLYREFSMWDEFSHWGVMVKEMFRLDQFYSATSSTLMVHKDYPPLLQCYEYFYCYISGGYSEYFLIKALHLFEFSLLLSFFENEDKNKSLSLLRSLLMVASIYFLITLFDRHGVINTIYTDYFMALLVVYILSNIFFNRNYTSFFQLFNLSLSLSFLLLTKQMGLPFYLMCIFFFVLCLGQNKNKTNHPVLKIGLIFVSLLLPLCFYTMWNTYTKNLQVEKQFDLQNIEFKEIQDYQKQTFKNYKEAINHESLISSYLKLSYLDCMILFLILFLILLILGNKYIPVVKTIKLNITLFLGFYGYKIVMLFLYAFCFGEVEGPTLASFNRYMATYVLIVFTMFILIFNFILNKIEFKKKWLYTIILILFLLGIQNFSNYKKFIPALKKDEKSIYEKCAEDLKNKSATGKIYIVAQNSEGQFEYRIKYYADAITTNRNHIEWAHFNEQQIKEITNSYDYIYFAQIDEAFIKEYSYLFLNLNPYTLYKIKDGQYQQIS